MTKKDVDAHVPVVIRGVIRGIVGVREGGDTSVVEVTWVDPGKSLLFIVENNGIVQQKSRRPVNYGRLPERLA